MKNFRFAILDPRPIPAAAEANEKIFVSAPQGVLGIEVTVPALAARCVLGNIDPQHSPWKLSAGECPCCGHPMEEWDDQDGRGIWVSCTMPGCGSARSVQTEPPAAIEVALKTTLSEYSQEVTLATVRADLDSVGVMAVLDMIAEGLVSVNDNPLVKGVERLIIWPGSTPGHDQDGLRKRIRLVAESDRFARGGWPGVRPLPTAEKPYDDATASAESDSRLAPMAAAVADFKVPLETRVELIKKWLLTGEEPVGYRERWLAERQALAKAIADGAIKTSVVAHGQIAVVESTHRAATSVGYCLAPVVVALNPEFRFGNSEPHRKFTVCQFTAEYVDLKAALADFVALEPGWGGSPVIIGSPQGVTSMLTTEQVIGVAEKHLK